MYVYINIYTVIIMHLWHVFDHVYFNTLMNLCLLLLVLYVAYQSYLCFIFFFTNERGLVQYQMNAC